MSQQLPSELLLRIFDMAVDDQVVLDYIFPNTMGKCSWFKMIHGNWSLQTPLDLFNIFQRKRYGTLKAIVSTCKLWRQVGTEFLFRNLFFTDPTNVQRICAVLDHDRNPARFVRRLHFTRYFVGGAQSAEEMQNTLISIIRHCPKLEIFVIDWPLRDTFTLVADALCTYCARSLRSLHLNVQCRDLAKVIRTLELLPNLVSLHITMSGLVREGIQLGAASGLALTFARLEHLSLRGCITEFMEQAFLWNFPSLQSLSLEFLHHSEDFPDLVDFLRTHGSKLTYLDINSIPAPDVASILELCPLLTTFSFNPDWRLPLDVINRSAALVHRPHPNITSIGCHQLLHAFGVSSIAMNSSDDFTTYSIRRSNDFNFAAFNKDNFPNLGRVRLLNRVLLRDLEASNGPAGDCFERWERWWRQCAIQGIRLEDCTGAELGNLPEDEEEYVEEEEEIVQEVQPRDTLAEIRDLVRVCRQFSLGLPAGPPPSYAQSMQVQMQLGY